MIEEWRDIPGSDGMYQVSDLGNVRSVDRVITDKNGRLLNQKGRLLRQATDRYGYKVFTPKLNGRTRWALVHQMVLLAFRGPIPAGMLSRHLNGDPGDNRLSNLEYGTPSENSIDKVKHGRNKFANQTHCVHGHPYDASNTVIDQGWRRCRTCKNQQQQARRKANS